MKKYLIVSMVLLIVLATQPLNIKAQSSSIDFAYTSEIVIPLPKAAEAVLREKLIKNYNRPDKKYSFRIGSTRHLGSQILLTVVVTDTNESSDVEDYDVQYLSAAVFKNDKGIWQASFQGDKNFSSSIDKMTELPEESRRLLQGNFESSQIAFLSSSTYKFPWPSGISYYYSNPWHPAYGIGVDVGTTGADKRSLASIGGTITTLVICPNSSRLSITDLSGNTLGYLHLDTQSLQPYVALGASVIQGQVLGNIQPGAFDERPNCGYAVQNDISAHLHWDLPTATTFEVDGWSITYPNVYWVSPSGSHTFLNLSPVLPSTNIPNYGQTTACNQDYVTITGIEVTTPYICNANVGMTVSSTTVTGSGTMDVNVDAGGQLVLTEGFHVHSLSSVGQFWAHTL